jgi:hypothetical protein
VAALTLVWGSIQVVTQLAHEEQLIEATFAAADVDAIDVRVDDGSIRIVAGTGDEVRVTARVSDGLRATGHSQSLEDGTLVLRGDCPVFFSNFCNVAYTVQVPAGVSVHARTENDDVVVTGVDGPIDARSGNGAVRVEGGAAPYLKLGSDNGTVEADGVRAEEVDASSGNGDVDLTLLVAPSTVRARSDNGDVDVVVPDDPTAYLVEASSDNGSRSVAVRTDPDATRRLVLRSGNGDVTVRYPS